MAATLRLEIVTPEARTYSDDVETVVIPGTDGEFGVLPGHEPLMTSIEAGELRIVKDGKEIALAVGQGFAEVTGDRVSVLTDMALRADAIDEAAAEAARKRAEEALAQKLGSEEQALVEASLQKALAQLHVKRRHRDGSA